MDTESMAREDRSECGTVISVKNVNLEEKHNHDPENIVLGYPGINAQVPEITSNVPLKDSGRSWLVCFSAFLIQVINVGVLHVFGVFFVAFLHEFQSTKAETAWIGSLAYGLTMLFGIPTSSLIKRFGHRPVAMLGSFMCIVSLVVSSFATSIHIMFGTFAVLYGIGLSLAYTPTMCIADDYFEKYVSIATGMMVAGSSTGTLVLSPLTQALVEHGGWRQAMRFLAGISVITIFCGFTFKPLTPRIETNNMDHPTTKRVVKELQLWKNRVFVVWVLAITLVMFGYYIPYVHLVSHAKELGIPPATGSILIMVLGASTATGRLLFGKIIDIGYLNRLNMHQLSMVVTGTACMLLPLIKTFELLVVYAVMVGLVDGCYVVLLPVLTASWAGEDNRIKAWGYLVGVSSVTYTLGPPVAGWIYDTMGSYDLAFHIAGIPIILGAVALFLIPWAKMTSTGCNDLAGAQSVFEVGSLKSLSSLGTEKDLEPHSTEEFSRKQNDEDTRTLTSLDSCIVVNLKSGTFQRMRRPRTDSQSSRETERESEYDTLHDIAQAIEILSHHSTSLLSFDVRSMLSNRESSQIVPADYTMPQSPIFSRSPRGISPLPGSIGGRVPRFQDASGSYLSGKGNLEQEMFPFKLRRTAEDQVSSSSVPYNIGIQGLGTPLNTAIPNAKEPILSNPCLLNLDERRQLMQPTVRTRHTSLSTDYSSSVPKVFVTKDTTSNPAFQNNLLPEQHNLSSPSTKCSYEEHQQSSLTPLNSDTQISQTSSAHGQENTSMTVSQRRVRQNEQSVSLDTVDEDDTFEQIAGMIIKQSVDSMSDGTLPTMMSPKKTKSSSSEEN